MNGAKQSPNSPGTAPLSAPVYLSRSVGDRILLAIFTPAVAALTGGLALFVCLCGLPKPDIVIRLGALVVAYFSFTFFSFSLLVFVWALFTPAWIERLLVSQARRTMFTAGFLVTGTVLGAIYFCT